MLIEPQLPPPQKSTVVLLPGGTITSCIVSDISVVLSPNYSKAQFSHVESK